MEVEKQILFLRKLSNQARYKDAHTLARRLMKKYPKEIIFAHIEAVMTAEGNPKKYPLAVVKLKKLLYRLRGKDPLFSAGVRNEYYWFSEQPYKQYLLGREGVARGIPRSHYSQGVGAERLARKYALKGKSALSLRWAKRSEKAWLSFFKEDSKWFNSYFFYAAALAYQGRIKEMDIAFNRAAKIAGKSPKWKSLTEFRADAIKIRKKLEHVLQFHE